MKYIKKIKPFSKDARGTISYLHDKSYPLSDVLLLISKKGSVRAEHYHKKDTHSIYVVSGKIEYTCRDMHKPNAKARKYIVNEGEVVTSLPQVAHKVVALKDTIMVVTTTESRERKKYEKDTVRLKI